MQRGEVCKSIQKGDEKPPPAYETWVSKKKGTPINKECGAHGGGK